MDESRKRAYMIVLSSALLHIKWDLSCISHGVAWIISRRTSDSLSRAMKRSRLFHNLAIFSTFDFERFDEIRFWSEVDQFHAEDPDAICPYRDIFDKSLRGEEVHIIRPSG
jgi:hypothetical protein